MLILILFYWTSQIKVAHFVLISFFVIIDKFNSLDSDIVKLHSYASLTS